MLSCFKLATAALLTFGTLSFAQDVTLTLNGNDLDYTTNQPIAGFQFGHDGCVTAATGGDASAADFMISVSETVVLGFSMQGFTFGESGSGTMIVLDGTCTEDDLSSFIISNAGGEGLDVEFGDGGSGGDCESNDNSDDCNDFGGCWWESTTNECFVHSGCSDYNIAPLAVECEQNNNCDWDNELGCVDCFEEGACAVEFDHVVAVGGDENSFDPADLQIDSGETVLWVNDGGFHNVDGSMATYPNNPSSFYSGSATNDIWTYSYTFDVEGSYDYECNPHASMMVGTVTVGSGGCTDPDACNADADADFDDGSCEYESCATSTVDILYDSDEDIAGFQFNVSGATVTGASGGAAADAGFTVSTSASVVLGFSFSGSVIPAGSGVLTTLTVEGGDPCLSDLVLSGAAGNSLNGEVVDCTTIVYSDDCPSDVYDCAGVCDGAAVEDCAGECGGSAEVDECGECGGGGIDEGACDCAGNVEDCAGDCGGDAIEDDCGVCNGDGTSCGDDHIDLSFGAIADGSMEILMTNTMAISGFQFNITGVNLDGASGGRAADAGFEVSTGVDGIVLGFSFTGGEIPIGSGVLTNLSFSALSDEACITNEVLALGEWSGGFYAINIGDCAALDYSAPSSTADVLYDSDSDIAGFQFQVDGDVTVTGVSGGAAEAAGFMLSTGGNTVLGFSLTGSVVSAGSGTLLTLEYTGDGSPCLSDLVLSDPDANQLDATIDCLTISYEAPCDDADNDGICDDVDDCVGAYDCAGDCNGSAVEDDCGVCNGSNADDLGCGCFEPGPSGCDNACGSTNTFPLA